MNEKKTGIIFVLVIFFLLDLIKPLGYFLHVQFLFLGIIFLSFQYSYIFSLVISIIFGYLSYCISSSYSPFYLLEFPCIVLFIHRFNFPFHKIPINVVRFYLVLLGHILLHNFQIGAYSVTFTFFYIIHSSVIYFILNHFFLIWTRNTYAKYI